MSNEYELHDLLPLLELNEYISLDLETTGLDPKKDRITEISACRFVNGEFAGDFTTLINPGLPIPAHIVEITNITDEMVRDAPQIQEVLPDLIAFLGDSPLVGQNIQFDYSFLNQNLPNADLGKIKNTLYDTMILAQSFIYYHNSFSLGSLCDFYDIKIEQAHRAKSDALSTGKLFIFLIKEVLSKPLNLIQRIDNLLKDTSTYNAVLFANIIKTSIRFNTINGLLRSSSAYIPPNNTYEYKPSGDRPSIPANPEEWFCEGGSIPTDWDGYEFRSSQIELIRDAYSAFSGGEILAAEAGTGLGKSLAYLSSGFLAANQMESALVVSTYTKNLQNQLFDNDIPKFSQAIDQNLTAVIYKGRFNYICQTRLELLLSNHKHLLRQSEYVGLLPLIVWEWETKTGDISECNGFQMKRYKRLWTLVRSEKGYCSVQRCKKYEGCFLGKVRSSVNQANIIIINHSLFANELLRDSSSLPQNFIYVIDEAHHFASVIRDQLVTQFGADTINDVIQFFNSGQDKWKTTTLKRFPEILRKYESLAEESKFIQEELKAFFSSYYRSKNGQIERSDYSTVKVLYHNSEKEFLDINPLPWDVSTILNNYEKNVRDFGASLEQHKDQLPGSISIEFNAVEGSLREGIQHFNLALNDDAECVKWSSIFQSEYKELVYLHTAPIRVNEFIFENLIDIYPGGIFCSATLTVNDEFNYFLEKVGLNLAVVNQNVNEKIYYSPFHYDDQVRLFVYRHSIDVNDPQFMQEIGSQIDRISKELKKRMLVLCTSYKQTMILKNYLQPKFTTNDRRLFVQSPGISRNVLVRSYLEYPHSILVGTSSFWEGVDFPGDKVEILYIVKTPFDNPFEPLIQAQIEDYNQRGNNAFAQFQIPEAAMRFRQGFGRLIRNMNDTGICVVGDTRLFKRGYGKTILGSLPVEPIPFQQIGTLISESRKFF